MRQVMITILFTLLFVSGCAKESKSNLQNVGMIFTDEISEGPLELKAYEGLLNIKEQFDAKVFYEEHVNSKHEVIAAVDRFVRKGANLIIGHSNNYGRTFVEISHEFPNVHFVYLGGGYFNENVTSMNINTHAMSFFAGMIASKMSVNQQVGIIAAYEWQPEIEGFYEGVKYQDPNVNVHINIVNDWNKQVTALNKYEELKQKAVDVIYPVGDTYSGDLIKAAKKDGIYTIGYLVDQSNLDEENVLTSTIQHIDKLYTYAADRFNEQLLEGGLLTFDFQDGFISLGKFSEKIPKDFQSLMLQLIVHYKETSLLPSEKK